MVITPVGTARGAGRKEENEQLQREQIEAPLQISEQSRETERLRYKREKLGKFIENGSDGEIPIDESLLSFPQNSTDIILSRSESYPIPKSRDALKNPASEEMSLPFIGYTYKRFTSLERPERSESNGAQYKFTPHRLSDSSEEEALGTGGTSKNKSPYQDSKNLEISSSLLLKAASDSSSDTCQPRSSLRCSDGFLNRPQKLDDYKMMPNGTEQTFHANSQRETDLCIAQEGSARFRSQKESARPQGKAIKRFRGKSSVADRLLAQWTTVGPVPAI